MLRSYLTVALRTLRRNLGYTAINLVGLAVGLAACILIGLYARFELSYDTFHEKSDRIYRVDEVTERFPDGNPYLEMETGPALTRAIPDIEHAVRFLPDGPAWMQGGDDVAEKLSGVYAGPAFFEIFSFDLVAGTDSTALRRPNTIVLTESLATRLFGREEPVGKTVTIEIGGTTVPVEVTGVAEDVPANSHLTFDYLLSLETLRGALGKRHFGAREVWTYVLLEKGVSPSQIETPLQKVAQNYAYGEGPYRLTPRPLETLYFQHWTSRSGDVRYLYILGAIALAILAIACANYMNLATARATRRIREVGVRKTLGAHRTQLAGQFLGETLLLSLLALPLALGLLWALLPTFNRLADAGIQVQIGKTPGLLVGAMGATVAVGLVAGSYPALFLSRFQPVEILRERLQLWGGGAYLRKALIVVQFALSAALIFSTVVILRQLHYVQHKKLGFDQERVVTIPLKDRSLRRQANALKQEVLRQPTIQHATLANGVLSESFAGSASLIPWQGKEITLNRESVDDSFLETMDLTLLAGRNFTTEEIEVGRTEKGRSGPIPIILNETAIEAFGWTSPKEAVGRVIEQFKSKKVIGVVEDFHYKSLHHRIEPLALEPGGSFTLVARLAPGTVAEALDGLRATSEDFAQTLPFESHFLDDQLDQLYRQERRTATIIGGFAGLAIVLACLGLLGLAAYEVERRTKEIGIRKTLGATATNIVTLLSKEFLLLVGIACAIAVPVAYVGMSRWLRDFAYRVDVSPWLFVGVSALAVAIALATISVQALRAARTDPATTLRDE